MKLSLCGSWEYRQSDESEWREAIAPSCNFLNLVEGGYIADPFVGANEKEVGWVSEKDWVYRKSFVLSQQDFECDHMFLVCDMLDTIADITLNDTLVASVQNCHLRYQLDIKDCAKVGENNLEILFFSPVNYVNKKQAVETAPANNNGLNGIVHIRKPQCHFGWDWGPILTPSGISGDIYIQTFCKAKIDDFVVVQRHFDGQVELQIVADVKRWDNAKVDFKISVVSPEGQVEEKSGQCDGKACASVSIKKPLLWWTRELSSNSPQPLYEVCVEIISNGITLDKKCKKVGLRTIELDQSKDKYGQNFQFVLNGVAIFAKGANWIPPDSFVNRVSKQTLEFYIKSAADCNFNMLRVWGGGYYESDDFYDLCDSYGILVWQDFAFACQPYPFFEEEFRQNVAEEVECNVKRLRHHASLCLWCGNNEIELMSIAWITRKKYVDWTKKYFYDILPQLVAKYDSVTPYIAGTPIGSAHNKGTSDDNIGDTHLWAVWHGLQNMQYYRKRLTRFCSEFGFESLPDIKCIEKFAQPKDYSLESEVFRSHQKCASGNKKMEYYIASRFVLPKKFEDYIYLSQVCQAECIKDATEHWRRNKGRCNGSLFWQYNDCWPTCSWASIDYFQNFKALQYASKEFFAPIMLSIEDSAKQVKIYSVNDTQATIEAVLQVEVMDFAGDSIATKSKKIVMQPNSSKQEVVYEIKALVALLKESSLVKKPTLKDCVVEAQLVVNGKKVCRKTLLFDKEKNIKLPKPDIDVKVEIVDGVVKYTLNSKQFVRIAQLGSKVVGAQFDKNYFDILPFEPCVVEQRIDKSNEIECHLSAQQLEEGLTIFSAVDIEARASKLSDLWTRTKIFLIPINFFSWIYYKSLKSKKIKEEKSKE